MAAVTTGVGTRGNLISFGRLTVLTACACLAIAAGVTFAQEKPAPPRRVRVVPDAAAQTAGTTRTTGAADASAEPQRIIPLYPGEARLIEAPWPVARVSVANPHHSGQI